MPLRLNVGASKKVGEANYGSRGASVNLELELDSNLIAEPAKLQEKIRQLFSMVRSSLVHELNGHHEPEEKATIQDQRPVTPATPTTPNGRPQHGGITRPATPAQVKALYGISRQKGVDLKALLQERCQVHRPDDLTVRQASTLIDELRAMEEATSES